MTWGPWINHDGKGCPVKGRFVRVQRRNGAFDEIVAWTQKVTEDGVKFPLPRSTCDKNPATSWWAWSGHPGDIVRYRICKPRGMELIEQALQGKPVREDA